ncbi:MAG: type II toxin-antitoxin system RelE/ParE family toxin [Woeseiaceae bacterium]|nr:type II toxin-antitoxin system RelE/ParE family toxin [Woeseiaceae bacterium]
MSFRVRFTLEAKSDLERLYSFLAEQDLEAAERALAVIDRAWTILEEFPFSCRKAEDSNPFVREIVIPFGSAGYVALFEIEDRHTVTVLAVRHQREDDYR